MVRYLVVAAGALAIMSGVAAAETTVVTRTSPSYTAPHHATAVKRHAPRKTTIVKKRVNRYGQLVTVKKTSRDGFSGSSVSRTRTVTNPETGVTRSTTTVRE